MNNKYTILTLLGLMSLLLVGSVFAADGSVTSTGQINAAFVQASQLQLNLDKAITVGNAAIVKINAAGNDTTNLSVTLQELVTLRNSIDPNTTTVDQVQTMRKQAEAIVASFRTQAHKLLGEQERQDIKASAQAKFEVEHKERQEAVKGLRQAFNARNLDKFAEAQQRFALGLNASDNISVVPELNSKLDDIRAKIERDEVSREEIGQMRTQIKAEVESIKQNRTAIVSDVRVNQLKQRTEMMEVVIAKATEANLSVTNLQYAHDSIVTLLSSYANGSIDANTFAVQAKVALEASTKVMYDPAFASIRPEIMKALAPMRVMVQNQSKQELEQWKEQREQMMNDIKEQRGNMNGLREQVKEDRKDARDELKNVTAVARRDGSGMGGLRTLGDGERQRMMGGNDDERQPPVTGQVPPTSVDASANVEVNATV